MQNANGPFRSWPFLVVAFGILTLVMATEQIITYQRAEQLNRATTGANEAYHRRSRDLEQVRSGIQMTSLLIRDYLLDPSRESGPTYRRQITERRGQTDRDLANLIQSSASEETTALKEMQSELNAYWAALDPVFEWTSQEKLAYSHAFLRHRVVPKRAALLNMAADVEAFNNAALAQQRTHIAQRESEFRSYLRTISIASIGLALLVAIVTVRQVFYLERRNAEQHLRTQEAEDRMRQLSHQLVRAQEEERKAISRELHDEIGQLLTGLRMEFRSLAKLHGAPAEQFQKRIEQGRAVLDQALQSVRDIAMGLRPSMLDDLGLEAALQWQAREFCRRHDVPVNLTVNADLNNLPDAVKTNLFRVVQEALTNCARHARASAIQIRFDQVAGALRVRIEDNGIGIPGNAAGRGLGLIGIAERARQLGGNMTIESKGEAGGLIVLTIPAAPKVVCA